MECQGKTDGGRERMETPSTTRATKARRASSGDEERTGGPGTAAPPHPQRGMVAYNRSAGTLLRHIVGTDGARPKHGTLACRKYGLLALVGTGFDPAVAGIQGSGNDHKDTRGTANQAQRETEVGGRNQSACTPSMRHVRGQ